MNSRAPLKKDKKGFTIIEVMIVLALGGLIILIVFLAIPALQRNSRNTQRRNDAARVSGLMAEYVSNNNGRLPTAINFTGSNVANRIQISQADLSIYEATNNGLRIGTGVSANVDQLRIVTGQKCEGNVLTAGGGSRSYAISFRVETSNSATAGTVQCI